MFELLALASFTAIGAWLLLMWLPGRKKLLGLAGLFDAVFSIGLVLLSAGTFSGLALAFMAGVIFHLLMRLSRWWCGYEVLSRDSWTRWRWVDGEATD